MGHEETEMKRVEPQRGVQAEGLPVCCKMWPVAATGNEGQGLQSSPVSSPVVGYIPLIQRPALLTLVDLPSRNHLLEDRKNRQGIVNVTVPLVYLHFNREMVSLTYGKQCLFWRS